MTSSDELRETIGRVLGRTPSGVFILTAADGAGNTTGMLASWVQQAAFDPPSVTVAVNRKRYLNDWLEAHPHMVLNLVGESQKGFLGHFGRGFEPDQHAFDGQNTTGGESGVPLLTNALGCLQGRVAGRMDAGDHVIYLVELTSAVAGAGLGEEGPMVHIRKDGFSY